MENVSIIASTFFFSQISSFDRNIGSSEEGGNLALHNLLWEVFEIDPNRTLGQYTEIIRDRRDRHHKMEDWGDISFMGLELEDTSPETAAEVYTREHSVRLLILYPSSKSSQTGLYIWIEGCLLGLLRGAFGMVKNSSQPPNRKDLGAQQQGLIVRRECSSIRAGRLEYGQQAFW
jgi:hypothetical protein